MPTPPTLVVDGDDTFPPDADHAHFGGLTPASAYKTYEAYGMDACSGSSVMQGSAPRPLEIAPPPGLGDGGFDSEDSDWELVETSNPLFSPPSSPETQLHCGDVSEDEGAGGRREGLALMNMNSAVPLLTTLESASLFAAMSDMQTASEITDCSYPKRALDNNPAPGLAETDEDDTNAEEDGGFTRVEALDSVPKDNLAFRDHGDGWGDDNRLASSILSQEAPPSISPAPSICESISQDGSEYYGAPASHDGSEDSEGASGPSWDDVKQTASHAMGWVRAWLDSLTGPLPGIVPDDGGGGDSGEGSGGDGEAPAPQGAGPGPSLAAFWGAIQDACREAFASLARAVLPPSQAAYVAVARQWEASKDTFSKASNDAFSFLETANSKVLTIAISAAVASLFAIGMLVRAQTLGVRLDQKEHENAHLILQVLKLQEALRRRPQSDMAPASFMDSFPDVVLPSTTCD